MVLRETPPLGIGFAVPDLGEGGGAEDAGAGEGELPDGDLDLEGEFGESVEGAVLGEPGVPVGFSESGFELFFGSTDSKLPCFAQGFELRLGQGGVEEHGEVLI